MSINSLDFLFPVPSLPPSRLSPGRSPGVSAESTKTLQNVLKDNHIKWHIFFNDLQFHNHAAHRAIAAWALGADADTIRKGYERDCQYEKPAIKSPGPITVCNFNEHLGDERYFDAYMRFFVQHMMEHDINSTIEEFVFTRKANISYSNEAGDTQPQMLNRFFAGALHSLIHIGYSAEFSLPGMLVEGLAQVAVHPSIPGLLEPLLLFEDPLDDQLSKITLGSALKQSLEADALSTSPVTQITSGLPVKDDPHALTILARVLRDPKFCPSPVDREDTGYIKTVTRYSKDIASYVNAWHIDPAILADDGWEKKVEELVWTVVVLYGIAGWTHGRDKPGGFLADFFLMHLVTPSIFLPSLCALISPISRSRLLKTYLAVACIWAVGRGQPTLDVKGFVEATKLPADVLANGGAPQMDDQTSGNGDLWNKILEDAKVHHDEHATKIIRSLAGWSNVFGTRRARLPFEKQCEPSAMMEGRNSSENPNSGRQLSIDAAAADKDSKKQRDEGDDSVDLVLEDAPFGPRATASSTSISRAQSEHSHQSAEPPGITDEADYLPPTELPGSEYLDGTLFLRVALLTLRRMGWDFEKTKSVRKKQGRDDSGKKEEQEEFWDFQGFFEHKPC